MSFYAAESALIVTLVLLLASPARAQEPVEKWADYTSWATALANPTIAAVQAARSSDPKCRLGQLALSEAIGNGATLALKHLIVSPRPCVGCAPDGMPSGHTMNSAIGVSSRWQVGLFFTLGTAELRTAANRHTPAQVAAGAALGFVAEWAGHRLLHCTNP